MTLRSKLLSAICAIGMAMAVGGAQAAELLTADQLDSVSAGAAGAAAAFTTTGGTAVAGASNNPTVNAVVIPGVAACNGPCAVAAAF